VAAKFDTPALFENIEIIDTPKYEVGSMAGSGPFIAKAKHNEGLGFPGELVDNWQEIAIARLGELVKGSRALVTFLDSCVKCGACTDKCHYYLGTCPLHARIYCAVFTVVTSPLQESIFPNWLAQKILIRKC